MKQIIFLAISLMSLNSFAYSNQQCQGVIAFSSSTDATITENLREKCKSITLDKAKAELTDLFSNYSSCQLYVQNKKIVESLDALALELEGSNTVTACSTYSLQLDGEVVFSDYLSYSGDNSDKSVLVKLDYIE